MRTFIAVKLTPEPAFLRLFSEVKKELAGNALKWVDEKNLHLTLKFLGEMTIPQVEKVRNVLSVVAAQAKPALLELGGLGYFKNHGMPRVLFVRIYPEQNLQYLAATLDYRLFESGFKREDKEFNPHLTLARIKFLNNKMKFYELIERHKNLVFEPVSVDEVILFESILKPAGPVYKVVDRFQLKALA